MAKRRSPISGLDQAFKAINDLKPEAKVSTTENSVVDTPETLEVKKEISDLSKPKTETSTEQQKTVETPENPQKNKKELLEETTEIGDQSDEAEKNNEKNNISLQNKKENISTFEKYLIKHMNLENPKAVYCSKNNADDLLLIAQIYKTNASQILENILNEWFKKNLKQFEQDRISHLLNFKK